MNAEPWGPVDDLVVATGGRDEAVAAVIARHGPAVVADVLASEVRTRGLVPAGASDAALNLVMTHDGASFPYVVSFKDGRFLLDAGRAAGVLAELRFSVLDLARLLYPHRAGYRSTTRDVRVEAWPWAQAEGDLSNEAVDDLVRRGDADPEQLAVGAHEAFARLFAGAQSVIAACAASGAGLGDLAARFGADKWGGLHWYTQHYEHHFHPFRYDPVRVLEIGIGGYRYESLGGDSLYAWQQYFPRGLVVGMDLHPKPNVVGPRLRVVQGDQGDAGSLRDVAEAYGPFDVVIDDGSHVNEHVRTTFDALFPHVRPGGYYVVEDLHTSYWPAFGGEAPPGSPATTMGLLKDLLDAVQASEFTPGDDAVASPEHPSDVSVYHNVAFLRKGTNAERGVPAWIEERASRQMGTAPATDGRA